MIETFAVFALICPTILSIGFAWLLIRQGKASAGIFTGLSCIAILLVIGIILINKDVADCINRNQQEYPNMPSLCGEWSGVIVGALIACSLIDAVVFLFVSLTIARRYQTSFTWPSAFLAAVGLVSIIFSIINYIDIKPYFEALPVSANAVKYYASFAGVTLGFMLIAFAVARARKRNAQ